MKRLEKIDRPILTILLYLHSATAIYALCDPMDTSLPPFITIPLDCLFASIDGFQNFCLVYLICFQPHQQEIPTYPPF